MLCIRIWWTNRIYFLFLLLLLCFQCQICTLALHLLNKEHKENILSVFEKSTSLGSILFSFSSSLVCWFISIPSQFPFSIYSNINRKRTPKHIFSCSLFPLHKRSEVAGCGWWIVSGYAHQHAHSCASSALCTLNAAHHKGTEWAHESWWKQATSVLSLPVPSSVAVSHIFLLHLRELVFIG